MATQPFFVQWDRDNHCLEIRIASRFLQNVARETIDTNPADLELIPEFLTRDSQIEAIGMLLLAELKQENLGGRLYIESLANVLAVHLLRQYAAPKLRLAIYEGGLQERQVIQVLEYINEHLNQDIKLADLAQLLGMSQFYFSHLFKQAIGTAPYQTERINQAVNHVIAIIFFRRASIHQS